ncbi:SirB2 family protein [Acinetobacter sp. WCHAc060025]|uniref:SirB2 family protein n=1 Tax=Acinetobacter sp. WCHAc060025 TaxID=2518625 RepID=UPI0010230DC5|nr:SirB2 family protein [Acinetobacter sp. WCHAc060025]RZG76919.1 invasion protein expression up-regulator SirB [Acinetobacter sp. WCHAc060025]
MDIHLLIKIIHMTSVAVLILVFVLRASTLFIGTQNQQPNPKGRVAFVALQHLSLTLIVLTGITLLVMNEFKVQPWFYAKIVLFIVFLSSQIKAYKKDDSILLAQRHAGLLIGAVALISTLALVMIKPVFS